MQCSDDKRTVGLQSLNMREYFDGRSQLDGHTMQNISSFQQEQRFAVNLLKRREKNTKFEKEISKKKCFELQVLGISHLFSKDLALRLESGFAEEPHNVVDCPLGRIGHRLVCVATEARK